MKSAGAVLVAALALAGGASGQVVARHVQDGELGVAPGGKPFVAYVRASRLWVASRSAKGRWQSHRVAPLAPGAALIVESGQGQNGPIEALMAAAGLTVRSPAKTDLAGIPRAIAGLKMPR